MDVVTKRCEVELTEDDVELLGYLYLHLDELKAEKSAAYVLNLMQRLDIAYHASTVVLL